MSDMVRRPSAKFFAAAIIVMGITRFILTLSGLPDSTVKYFSMTAIIIVGTFYFALTTATHKDRLKASYILLIPYMLVEVSALGYAWASGRPSIFHTKDYSFGTTLPVHTFGHFIGGLNLGAALDLRRDGSDLACGIGNPPPGPEWTNRPALILHSKIFIISVNRLFRCGVDASPDFCNRKIANSALDDARGTFSSKLPPHEDFD
jgi:hypothetical protein